MKRDKYKETLQNLKYHIEESDDIEEIKKHLNFLIDFNIKCLTDIENLKSEFKKIQTFLTDKNIITRKLSKKDITKN